MAAISWYVLILIFAIGPAFGFWDVNLTVIIVFAWTYLKPTIVNVVPD